LSFGAKNRRPHQKCQAHHSGMTETVVRLIKRVNIDIQIFRPYAERFADDLTDCTTGSTGFFVGKNYQFDDKISLFQNCCDCCEREFLTERRSATSCELTAARDV
jgi:hypothetical protein